MCKFSLPSPQDTMNLGAKLAIMLSANLHLPKAVTVILLHGPMGSGKTTFTRGFVNALPGANLAEVTSPSFSFINNYPTNPPVIHADLFRCPEQSLPEDLEEALFQPENAQNKSLVIVEWANRLPSNCLPKNRLDIQAKSCNNLHLFFIQAWGTVAYNIVEGLKKGL